MSISAKSRVGAEISALLESEFVKRTKNHDYFKCSEQSPNEATKNPWDAKTKFCINGYEEEIWIDFKAVKITCKDSNPDIGTPDKVINFIDNNNFYIVYIIVYYEETDNGLKFVEKNNKYVKSYFLKDISDKFRRNPKNQLQVNINAKPEYRTREEFINLLLNKMEEGYNREIENAQQKLGKITNENFKKELLEKNKKSEEELLKNILNLNGNH